RKLWLCRWRRVVHVVILVTIGDAAVPGIVMVWFPSTFTVVLVLCGPLVVPTTAASSVLVVPASQAVPIGLEIHPVRRFPIRIRRIAGSDIDVLGERNDRNIDVARLGGRFLELIEKLVRRSLESNHLVAGGHRAGIVERQRDTQPRVAPLGG